MTRIDKIYETLDTQMMAGHLVPVVMRGGFFSVKYVKDFHPWWYTFSERTEWFL